MTPAMASMRTGARRSGAVSAAETTSAVAPSQRDVAVVEAHGRGDHPRRQVVREGQRLAVDRVRVERGVGPLGDRDPAQLLAGHPELVQVARGEGRDLADRRERARRATARPGGRRPRMDGAVGRTPAGVARRAALLDRPPDDGVAGLAGGHRLGRTVEGQAHPLDLTLPPGGGDAQRVLDLVQVRPGVAGHVGRAAAGEHGQAVDVVDREPGVGHRGQDGVERELEAGSVELAGRPPTGRRRR